MKGRAAMHGLGEKSAKNLILVDRSNHLGMDDLFRSF